MSSTDNAEFDPESASNDSRPMAALGDDQLETILEGDPATVITDTPKAIVTVLL
jgi:hypothetical protein